MSKAKLIICPYCGGAQPMADECRACGGLFEPLSRQATHNAMGPWFVRDQHRPFQPGCSYDTLVKLIQRGKVTRHTIVRGPTTRQFWTIASRVPGISHYFGACHQCDASVDPGDHACHACGATFGAFVDRNFLGLPEYRPMPWEAGSTGRHGDSHAYGEPADLPQTLPDAGEPRGLSSFATDEELYGGANDETPKRQDVSSDFDTDGESATQRDEARPVTSVMVSDDDEGSGHIDAPDPLRQAAAVVIGPFPKPSESEPAPQSVATPAATAVRREEAVSPASLRAMQRRLAQQQRMMQRLAVFALIAGAVAVTAVIGWMSNQSGAPPVDATREAVPSNDATSDGAAGTTANPAMNGDRFDPLPDFDDKSPAIELPPTPSISEQAAKWDEDYIAALLDEAKAMLEQARDHEVPLSERVDAAERALDTLTRMENAPSELKPRNLERLIDEARRERDRLRLREFFP